MLTSYAQNFEDVMLWRALGHVDKGFYIDVGAQDPNIDSVSRGFYERGWRGVHVEPTPAYAQALRAARPDETVVQAAIGDGGALIPFFEIPDTGISTGDADIARSHESLGYAHRRIDVPCIRLSALLDNYRERDIHWMKVDVEGMELSVLRSWAPSPVRPWIIVLESTLPFSQEPVHGAWEAVVLGLGYRFAYFDGLNRFYVSRRHRELLKAFSVPPNLFDGFAIAGTASNAFSSRLNAAVAQARTEVDQIRLEVDELRRQLVVAQQNDEVRASLAESERRYAEQALEADRRMHRALDQSQQLTQTLERVELAKEETVQQLLRSLAAKDEALATQAASSQDESSRLRQSLAERDQLIGELRLELLTARADASGLQAEMARRQEDARARAQEREIAFDAATAMQTARNERQDAELLRIQQAFDTRVIEREEAVRAELEEQRRLFEAELATARSELRESELLKLQREMQGRLAEQEQAFRLQLESAQAGSSELRLQLYEQQRLAKAELTAARREFLESELLQVQREMQARMAEQEQWFRRQLVDAQAQANRLQDNLVKLQRSFSAEWEHLRQRPISRLLALFGWPGESARPPASGVADEANATTMPSEGYHARSYIVDSPSAASERPLKFDLSGWPRSANEAIAATRIRRRTEPPSIDSLLALDNEEFVEGAYRAVLNREPEEAGFIFYLDSLLAGTPKIAILQQIHDSTERQKLGTEVAGLRAAVAAFRRSTIPLVGAIFRSRHAEQVSASASRLRRIEQHVVRMQNELSQQAVRRHSESTEILAHLERLTDRLIELARIEGQGQLAPRAERPAPLSRA